MSSRDVLAARGIEHGLLDAGELRARGVELPPGWVALWQPDAGVVLRRSCDSAFRGDIPVERRRVETLDDVDADVVVVTAGAWVTKLVPDVPVRVTRETVAYFAHDGAAGAVRRRARRGHAPARDVRAPRSRYGLKAGAHHAGHVADPDVDEGADAAIVERIADWVRERFPGIDPTPVAGRVVSLYVDGRRVVRARATRARGRRLACSGHGFKFAPAVGRRLAGLALG